MKTDKGRILQEAVVAAVFFLLSAGGYAKSRNIILLIGVGPDGSSARGWHDNADIHGLIKAALEI